MNFIADCGATRGEAGAEISALGGYRFNVYFDRKEGGGGGGGGGSSIRCL